MAGAEGVVDVDIAESRDQAGERGVAVQLLSAFAVTAPPGAGLVLGYGAVPTARIEEGLRLLRACFDAG